LLNSYVKWLALGRTTATANGVVPPAFSWFSKGYKEAFASGDQEPWLFRGGLTGELQRLIPIESASDLYMYKPPDAPARHIYTIRPYLPSDERSVYEICAKASTIGPIERDVPTELLGDRLVGPFLCLSPEFCFAVEDESGLCGYAVGAVDAKQFEKKTQLAWLPDLCEKYPIPNDGNEQIESDRIIKAIHLEKSLDGTETPEYVLKNFPSTIRLDILIHTHMLEPSVAKRLLACVLAAIKANGSHGVYAKGRDGDKNFIEFYQKLGFHLLTPPPPSADYKASNHVFLGRAI